MKTYHLLSLLIISFFIFSCSKQDATTVPNNTNGQTDRQNRSLNQLVNPNKIRLTLDKVYVTEDQGIGEGDFELRIQATEGSHSVVWPGLSSWVKVDKGGATTSIDEDIATYTLSGSVTKTIKINVTEVDGGFNGGDDTGSGSVSITMEPDMTPSSKYVTVSLKRPNGKFIGKVKVYILAQVA